MDENRIPLPEWLPWAATAVLAALVASLGELWMVEKTRTQILRDDNALASTELKAVENQLEAERIINRREVQELGSASVSQSDLGVAFLVPPPGRPIGGSGVVVWRLAGRAGVFSFSGLRKGRPDGEYQLWLIPTDSGQPSSCGVFAPPDGPGSSRITIDLPSAVAEGCGFALIFGNRGGAATLEGAVSTGSIVLATYPLDRRISFR
jgi:hypothetical protein